MYCSSCGVAVAQGLSYCNRCGAKLSGAKGDDVTKSSEFFSESLTWAIVTVFIVGLGCIIALMALMKQLLNFGQGVIITFTFLSFLLLLGVEGVLTWLLMRQKKGAKEAGDSARLKGQVTKELDEAQMRALPEPVPSITEQTTRPFEPLYNERKVE